MRLKMAGTVVSLGELVSAWGDFQASSAAFAKELADAPTREAIYERTSAYISLAQLVLTAAQPYLNSFAPFTSTVIVPGITGGSVAINASNFQRGIQDGKLDPTIQAGIDLIKDISAITAGWAPAHIKPAAIAVNAIATAASIAWRNNGSEWSRTLEDLATALRDSWADMSAAMNDWWRRALQPQPRDPLAIDLDGDGIETIGVPTTGSPVLFDHDADGVRTGTGWVRPDDAWLVRDLNGNGTIDSGRELFGVDTLITVTESATQGAPARVVTRNATTGFEALRTLDTGNGTAGSAGHNDGRINASDAAFANLRIWRDLNQDGISQPAELQTLPTAGIAAISLTVDTTPIDLGNGNTVTGTAVVTRSNGSRTLVDTVQLTANNLDPADNPFYRQFTDTIPLSTAASALPEIGGSGWLRDPRVAMVSTSISDSRGGYG